MWRDHPDTLEADLHAVFGWDAHNPTHRDAYSGPWLRARVEALPWHPSSMVTARINADIDQARTARKSAEAAANNC